MRRVAVRVARVGEIPEGEGRVVTLPDGELCLLARTLAGEHFGCSPLCPHQNEPLDQGRLEGREIICRRHHLRFDLASGECTNAGGYSLKTYAVEVRDGDVYIARWEFD